MYEASIHPSGLISQFFFFPPSPKIPDTLYYSVPQMITFSHPFLAQNDLCSFLLLFCTFQVSNTNHVFLSMKPFTSALSQVLYVLGIQRETHSPCFQWVHDLESKAPTGLCASFPALTTVNHELERYLHTRLTPPPNILSTTSLLCFMYLCLPKHQHSKLQGHTIVCLRYFL